MVSKTQHNSLVKKVEDALAQIRPFLVADGGDVALVEVTSTYVAKVKLLGSCSSCHMAHMTMKAGVEEAVIRAVPQITEVVAVG